MRENPSDRIRLLVSDIDGTLINRDKQLTPATLAAVRRLREAGVLICLASSRSIRGMRRYLDPLDLGTPAAGLNGGEIVASDASILELCSLDRDDAAAVLDTLREAQVESWVFGGGEWLITDPDGAFVPRERRAVAFEPRVVDDFGRHLDHVGKIMGASADEPKLAAVEAELGRSLAGRVSAHLSSPWYLDVTHPDANKGSAAVRLAALLGIEPSEMACIGDMDNDRSMLRLAGLAVAMGNAPEPVRQDAHFITRTNEDDGWADAVERLILPRAVGA